MARHSFVRAAACVACLLPIWLSAAEVGEDPMERRTLEIAKDLRCAVCQNQPVSESNSDLARDMRGIIREKLEAGDSRDQIVNYFVDRYGNYVLMNPPKTGTGTPLWLIPLLVALILVVIGFMYLRSRKTADADATVSADAAAVSELDRKRIQALLEESEQ